MNRRVAHRLHPEGDILEGLMRHVFYALFDSHSQADGALAALRELGLDDGAVSVMIHEDAYEVEETEGLTMIETDAREGLIEGGVLGGVVGAIGMVALAGPAALVGIGPLLAALTTGGLAGGIYGGLGSFLYSLGIPDRSLESLASHLKDGRVLMTVETADRALEREVESIFEQFGAVEKRKHLV